MTSTRNQPCWLAEASKDFLVYQLSGICNVLCPALHLAAGTTAAGQIASLHLTAEYDVPFYPAVVSSVCDCDASWSATCKPCSKSKMLCRSQVYILGCFALHVSLQLQSCKPNCHCTAKLHTTAHYLPSWTHPKQQLIYGDCLWCRCWTFCWSWTLFCNSSERMSTRRVFWLSKCPVSGATT